MIDTLHKHGLYVSYDCIFCRTQRLAEESKYLFDKSNAVVPSNMRHGLLTIGAKDNINKDSSCTLDQIALSRDKSFTFPTFIKNYCWYQQRLQ